MNEIGENLIKRKKREREFYTAESYVQHLVFCLLKVRIEINVSILKLDYENSLALTQTRSWMENKNY